MSTQNHQAYIKEKMPLIGIGTWQIRDKKILYDVIDEGFRTGYRFIDTAQVYGNEAVIGGILEELLPKHGLTRSDIFITTKLAPANAGSGKKTRDSVEKSLDDLKMDYVDLMLIHWPGSQLKSENPKNKELRVESWNVLAEYQEKGRIRAIGVSNFEIQHLEELKNSSNIIPAVNQVEYHPHFHQDDLVKYCKDNGIHFQAYSSLGSPSYVANLRADPIIMELADKYQVSIPIILLGFAYCQGISVLPRTTNPQHAKENYEVTKLKIDSDDIAKLLAIKVDFKTCWDPRVVV